MNTRPTQMTPAQELAASVARPFEQACAMPKSVYTSAHFHELEQATLFSREWVCAGRASALSDPGDFLAVTIAGEPIVVVRDMSGKLAAFSNVCRHRMSTLVEGRGNARALVCPYHAWTYGLDGALKSAPAMTRNTDFRTGDICLPTIRCEEWAGWIMVTLNPKAPSAASRFAGIDALVGDYGMEAYVEAFREEFRWETNWKVLAENFMESYHLPVCHAGTIGPTVDLNQMTCPEGEDAFNYHWILKNDALDLSLAHPDNATLEGDRRRMTWLITVYPALMITLTPGYFWYLSLTPISPGEVGVLYGGGLSPEWAGDPEAQAHFERLQTLLADVNHEDKHCVERVYRGLSAGLSAPGPLSHLERPNYDFARWINERVNA